MTQRHSLVNYVLILVWVESLSLLSSILSEDNWPTMEKVMFSLRTRCQLLKMHLEIKVRQTFGLHSWRPSPMQRWKRRSEIRTGTPGG